MPPDCSGIRGTLERIEAVKGIARIKPDPNQGFLLEPDFERTEILWDTQKTTKNDQGEPLFIDDNGKPWSASRLTIRSIDRER